MTDVLEAVRDYLNANSALTALVSTRVYAAELPQAEIPDMPQKVVIVRPSGGSLRRGTVPVGRPRFEIWSTGETYHEAGKVDRAVFDALVALKRKDQSDVFLHCALPEEGARMVRDAITGWPAAVRSAVVIADERSTA